MNTRSVKSATSESPLRGGSAVADAPLVIVTGMSGAGRTTTANVLEDLGWLVVDNLPPQLLEPLAQLRYASMERQPEAAPRRVVAIRSGEQPPR